MMPGDDIMPSIDVKAVLFKFCRPTKLRLNTCDSKFQPYFRALQSKTNAFVRKDAKIQVKTVFIPHELMSVTVPKFHKDRKLYGRLSGWRM